MQKTKNILLTGTVGFIGSNFVLDEHSNLFEQKIDIVFNTDSTRLIEKEAIKWGIKL